jgi:hypothetical protein
MLTLDRRVVRLASLSLAALLVVGACGSSATPAPAGTTPAPAGTTPAPGTPAATDSTGGSFVIPSIDLNGAPDLEAKLPAKLCGADSKRQSFTGGAGADASANPMIGALGALGAGGNVNIAIAESTTPDTCPVSVFAYQVKGGNTQMFSAILAGMAAGGSQVSLGGKNVTKIDDSGSATYLYIKDDTMYGISDATDDQASEALSQLP